MHKYNFNELIPYIFGISSLPETFIKNKRLIRIPKDISKTISAPVQRLSKNTSGIRIRFISNLKTLVLNGKPDITNVNNHMTQNAKCGFDVYVDGKFWYSCYKRRIHEKIEFPWQNGDKHSYEIYFPLYNGITGVSIETDEKIEDPPKYVKENPIVVYGSSITQGGCATRPGLSYPAIVSRKLNSDFINLGFSGNGKGEIEMAKYLADVPASIFVLDFGINLWRDDYSVFTARYEPFLNAIRVKNPSTPIILINIQNWRDEILNEAAHVKAEKFREHILEVYKKHRNAGDSNLWYIDGRNIIGLNDFDATVDGCHPNDVGMKSYSDAIIQLITSNNILNKSE